MLGARSRLAVGSITAAGLVVLGPAMMAHAASAASSTSAGNDVSYPQCGRSLPSAPAFGIAGVNDGLANNLNPCFGPSAQYPSYKQSELYWAVAKSSGTTGQPKGSVYVNTSDPGNIYNGTPIADWPVSGSTPYGSCAPTTVTTNSGTFTVGENSASCAWQYGYDRASQDASWLTSAASVINGQSPPVAVPSSPSGYPWWLDVETANSWLSGPTGQAMNVADLQGMVAALTSTGATVGTYSTSAQWNQITGSTTTSAAGSLYQLPNWIPGARNLSGAIANCALASFTSGQVTVTQWTAKSTDYDHAC